MSNISISSFDKDILLEFLSELEATETEPKVIEPFFWKKLLLILFVEWVIVCSAVRP